MLDRILTPIMSPLSEAIRYIYLTIFCGRDERKYIIHRLSEVFWNVGEVVGLILYFFFVGKLICYVASYIIAFNGCDSYVSAVIAVYLFYRYFKHVEESEK